MMYRIMFVCHGNICRSTLAEFLMKDYVKKMGKEKEFYIKSSALSDEEFDNPVYPPIKRILNGLNIDCSGKRAELLNKSDYDKYDLFLIMDERNAKNIKFYFPVDYDNKIKKIMDYTDEKGDVIDPYFNYNYDEVYRQIDKAIKGLFDFLTKKA